MSSENTSGWKFVIEVPPELYKDHVVVWKPRPHVEINPLNTVYIKKIETELSREISTPFRCPVTIELDLYMATKRVAYPTSAAHLLMKALVPTLIEDPRFIESVTSRVHYNEKDDKNWAAKSVVTVYPSSFNQTTLF